MTIMEEIVRVRTRKRNKSIKESAKLVGFMIVNLQNYFFVSRSTVSPCSMFPYFIRNQLCQLNYLSFLVLLVQFRPNVIAMRHERRSDCISKSQNLKKKFRWDQKWMQDGLRGKGGGEGIG